MQFYRILFFILLSLFIVLNGLLIAYLTEHYHWIAWMINLIIEIIAILLLYKTLIWWINHGKSK